MLNPVTSRSAKQIFGEVMELPAPERAAFLEATCGSDAALRGEVEALLAAFDAADEFLVSRHVPAIEGASSGTVGAQGTVTQADDAGPHERPGTVIGRYKLLQEIGHGGFGTVFMAEQREPIVRRVALKVIKLGMDTRQVIARFQAERQALAMMDHPHIARVLDAGATDTGRPYFVMELVKGVPITQFCDDQHLAPRERLALFSNVCEAVQHAHQKGVIHRDLKPSNVLVSRYDDKPVVKIIDFGIAKAVAGKLTDKTLFTEFRALIGTPAYMSPEQAGMSDLDIDTRSDVYSLGVLLYELLTGTTPFDDRALRSAGYDELRRTIREVEPPKPSSRISAMQSEAGAQATGRKPGPRGIIEPGAGASVSSGRPSSGSDSSAVDIARARHTDPKSLVRLLRGDLDWIVMKCVEKDRTRRYDTANGLALDIGRFLSGEPVFAAPPSPAYKVRKFIHRHKVGVAAGVTIAGVLVLGIVGMTVGMAQTALERDEKQVVIDLMREMLGAADPHGLKDPDYTVRALLDDFDARFETHPIDRPEVEAMIRATMGEAYSGLGEYEKAVRHLKTALDIRRRILGDEASAELAALMTSLSATLRLTGQYDEAESMARAQLELQRRRLGEEHPEVALSLNNLAWVLWPAGKRDESAATFRTALEMQRRLLGEEDPQTAQTMSNFALLLMRMGRDAEAEPLAKTAVEVRQRLFGEDAPVYLYSLSIYAGTLHDQGRFEDAEPLYRKFIEVGKRVLGEEHPEIAIILHSLSFLVRERGRLAEAELLAREALRIRQKKLDENNPDIVNNKAQLAMILLDLGRHHEAEALARECVAAPDAHPGMFKFGRGPFYAMSLLGGALAGQAVTLAESDPAAAAAKFAEAEPLLIEGYEGMHVPGNNVITRRCNRDALERIVRLYAAWDATQPGQGHAEKAAEWRATIEAWQATTPPAAQPR